MIAVESNLDLTLAFARAALDVEVYKATARAQGLRIVPGEGHTRDLLIRRPGFSLQLFSDLQLARVPMVSLMEEPADDLSTDLGIDIEADTVALQQRYQTLRGAFAVRLGAPTVEGSRRGTCFLLQREYDYRYASWRFEDVLMTLLHDDWGDGQIGEYGTVDIRFSSLEALDALPDSIRQELCWPVDH